MHVGPTLLTSFLASLVEAVEALTVVLAVGAVRGWREALLGSAAGLLLLALLVAIFGRSLGAIPLAPLQLVIGTLALLFGLRWLRKAILRSSGALALHDEAKVFRETEEQLRRSPHAAAARWDAEALGTSFKIVLLEGVEVVFIVLAIADHERSPWPAIAGALGALLLVVALGLVLHRPLARVPENTLKFMVGVMLSAFGMLWVGESLGFVWPFGDAAPLALIAATWLVALALVPLCRRRLASAARRPRGKSPSLGLLALFVDDPWLALGSLGWIALGAFLPHGAPPNPEFACAAFIAGFLALLMFSVRRASTPAAV
jgi:uncharacterized membrane protein